MIETIASLALLFVVFAIVPALVICGLEKLMDLVFPKKEE